MPSFGSRSPARAMAARTPCPGAMMHLMARQRMEMPRRKYSVAARSAPASIRVASLRTLLVASALSRARPKPASGLSTRPESWRAILRSGWTRPEPSTALITAASRRHEVNRWRTACEPLPHPHCKHTMRLSSAPVPALMVPLSALVLALVLVVVPLTPVPEPVPVPVPAPVPVPVPVPVPRRTSRVQRHSHSRYRDRMSTLRRHRRTSRSHRAPNPLMSRQEWSQRLAVGAHLQPW